MDVELENVAKEINYVEREIKRIEGLPSGQSDHAKIPEFTAKRLQLEKQKSAILEKQLILLKQAQAAQAAGAQPGATGVQAGGAATAVVAGADPPNIPQREHKGISSEGLNARAFYTARADTVRNALVMVQGNGAVLIKAPPQSGKTSLLQLLKVAANQSDVFRSATFVSIAGVEASGSVPMLMRVLGEEEYHDIWSPVKGEVHAGRKLDLLLVDEAQLLYQLPTDPLWGKVKLLLQGQGPPHLRVIMAAMYGDRPSGLPGDNASPTCTPVDFNDSVITLRPPQSSQNHDEQPSLSLTLDEYEELLSSFNAVAGSGGLHDPQLRAYLFEVTAGQVGLITAVLDMVLNKVRKSTQATGLVDTVTRHVLTSWGMYASLASVRSILATGTLHQYIDVFEPLLRGERVPEGFVATARRLARNGWLLEAPDSGFAFISPLHQHYYLAQVSYSQASCVEDCSHDFDRFIVQCVQRMSAGQLLKSLSRGVGAKSRIYERHLQMEWYKSAVSHLPSGMRVAPDVGAVFGSPGRVDFWVSFSEEEPERGWAVELLCSGAAAAEHAARFTAPGGSYASLPHNKWAVVDFYPPSISNIHRPAPVHVDCSDPHGAFFYIHFHDDFSAADVWKGTQLLKSKVELRRW
eukprot:CAMPEP_0202861592 /NCGR_PEP_ID=MMETSP1391-20130828/2940_1 /ASSEMBLY_ACC=CAM_ASM_000867 /TAXON_ID=1034604 /ORGANISM="Chlamydomonas leiostraca, Strain SAG 11-49" /LENGTH=633 /DNA_ID=CAMNT_0049541007 /DNA_START=188 /DNA_END=2089 /DNA_ORIENTATION=+